MGRMSAATRCPSSWPPGQGARWTTGLACAGSVDCSANVGRTGGAGPPVILAATRGGTSMGQRDAEVLRRPGGESGLGLASARLFVAEGAKVPLLGLDEPRLKAAVE